MDTHEEAQGPSSRLDRAPEFEIKPCHLERRGVVSRESDDGDGRELVRLPQTLEEVRRGQRAGLPPPWAGLFIGRVHHQHVERLAYNRDEQIATSNVDGEPSAVLRGARDGSLVGVGCDDPQPEPRERRCEQSTPGSQVEGRTRARRTLGYGRTEVLGKHQPGQMLHRIENAPIDDELMPIEDEAALAHTSSLAPRSPYDLNLGAHCDFPRGSHTMSAGWWG